MTMWYSIGCSDGMRCKLDCDALEFKVKFSTYFIPLATFSGMRWTTRWQWYYPQWLPVEGTR